MGGGDSDDRIILLLNGVSDSHTAIQGGLGTPFEDSTLPVQGIKAFKNTSYLQRKNIFFVDEINTEYDPYEGITLDFWFYYDKNSGIDKVISTALTESGTSGFGFTRTSGTSFYFESSNNQKYMNVPVAGWHHICQTCKVSVYGSEYRHNFKTYVDGTLQYDVNYDFSSETITKRPYYVFDNQSGLYYHSDLKIAQVCVRKGIVWTENFTPPTIPYKI